MIYNFRFNKLEGTKMTYDQEHDDLNALISDLVQENKDLTNLIRDLYRRIDELTIEGNNKND